MTYGWAILAVMVIGVAMWHLGVFNMGDSVGTRTAGFPTLKPLETTCLYQEDIIIGFPGFTGISCQFVNTAGTPITIKNVKISIDEKYCSLQMISESLDILNADYLIRSVLDDTGDDAGREFIDR